jgi:hypothetical protein
MSDAVTRVITLLEAAPRERWEQTLRRELGGRHVYFSAATGRDLIRALIECGTAPRTARWKVRAR